MVIATLALLVAQATSSTQELPKPTTPGQWIGMAFKHYYGVKSAAGQIRLVQSAQNVSVEIDTQVVFDRPSLLYLEQTEAAQGKHWLTVSDGKYFWYDKPASLYGRDRLQEYVTQGGVSQTVNMMYDASSKSIGDRSPALDIVFAGTEDLRALKTHWINLHMDGKSQLHGRDVTLVGGDYCFIPGMEPTGSFQMAITDEGDLLQFTLKNRYGVPTQPGKTVEVTSIWDVDVKLNTTNDKNVYKNRG